MLEVSEKTKNKIYARVRADLEPTRGAVGWRVLLSLVFGGLISLFFCGQFGLGFSEMARNWNHTIHSAAGSIPCALICGAFFAIAPVLLLRLICSAILFRNIIRGYTLLQAWLIGVIGFAIDANGTFVHEALNVLVWSVSAACTYKLVGITVDQAVALMPRRQWE